MKTEIKIPSMGESISEVTIGAIFKKTGSIVKADEEILELETDKVNQVLFAPQAGLLTLSVNTSDTVAIGQVIGFVEGDASVKPEIKQEEVKQEVKPETKPQVEPQVKPTIESKAEPKAEPKVEPQTLQQTSSVKMAAPSARISKNEAVSDLVNVKKMPSDEMPKVLTHKKEESQIKGKRVETRRKMTKIRKVIAARLLQAKQESAMLTTFNEVDMSHIMQLRELYKDAFMKQHGVKLGFMSFFVKAAVAALSQFPDVNSRIDGDEIVHPEYYDIGIAVGTDKGLVVPVIRDCDMLTFSGIELTLEEYAKKAKTGGLTVDDLTGGSFTITNGGVYGSLLSTPIINYPQSAILGMHKIMKRAVVVDDEIVIKPMMYLALSYDHRIIDGKEAVSFLVMVKNMLEDPTRLLLEV